MRKSSGGTPKPTATSKSFNSAASGKTPVKQVSSATTAPQPKFMTPQSGGMADGPTPPAGARVAADRKPFATQMASAKAQASAAKKPKPTASESFNRPARPIALKPSPASPYKAAAQLASTGQPVKMSAAGPKAKKPISKTAKSAFNSAAGPKSKGRGR